MTGRIPAVLHFATRIWKRGDPIPVDLEVQLMQLGYDVRALEDKHRIS